MIIPPLYGIGAGCPNFRLHPISVSARLRRDGSARQGGFWFQLYRARIVDKLGLRSRADLTRYALEMGLLNPVPSSPG